MRLPRLFAPLLGLTLVACSSDGAGGAAATASASAKSVSATVAPEVELDALLRGITSCKLNDRAVVDPACPGAVALRTWAGSHKAWLDEDHRVEAAAVGARYVTSPSVAVRIEAWNLVARRVADDPALQKLVAETAKTEQEEAVLVSLAAAAARAPQAATLRELLVGMLADERENVRRRATEALVPTNAPPLPEVRASILSALKSGPMDVRKKICQRLRVGDDAELLKAVSQLLDTASTPATLFDDCLYGLTLSWLGPQVDAPSKGAYERSLACLEKCKRTDERIGLGVSLMNFALKPKPDAKPLPAFADVSRIEKAIVAIIQDEKAQDTLRFSAAMAFDDADVAAKKSGVDAKTLLRLGAKAADPAR